MKNSTNKSINRSTSESINKSTNESMNESMNESAQDLLKNIPQKDVRNVRRILAYIKGVSYEIVMLYPEKILLNQEEQRVFAEFLERYERSEPVSKIIGIKSFWKNDFLVNSAVLDPRPETEAIIEAVLRCFEEQMVTENGEEAKNMRKSPQKILDIGTGSGCILLSLLGEFEKTQGIGIDISQEAIEVAQKNKERMGIDCDRAVFLNIGWNDLRDLGDLEDLRGLRNLRERKGKGEDQGCGKAAIRDIESVRRGLEDVDVIVSNPPYIRSSEIEGLDENVRNYDPRIALDGGKDGLDSYREICAIAAEFFGKNQRRKNLWRKQSKNKKENGRESDREFVGRIFFEVGYDQAKDVAEILKKNGFKAVKTSKDLAGIERVLEGVFCSEDSDAIGRYIEAELMNR